MFVSYDLFLFSHLKRLSSQVVSLGREKFSGSHLDVMTGWVACGVIADRVAHTGALRSRGCALQERHNMTGWRRQRALFLLLGGSVA